MAKRDKDNEMGGLLNRWIYLHSCHVVIDIGLFMLMCYQFTLCYVVFCKICTCFTYFVSYVILLSIYYIYIYIYIYVNIHIYIYIYIYI